MNLEDISKKADDNAKLINENKKLITDNMKKIQSNFEQIQNNSLALDILKEFKEEINKLHNEKERQHNIIKKLFHLIILIVLLWTGTIAYLVYILNDVGTYEEDTIDIQDVETVDNSHIKIGDDIWEKSE